MIFALVGSLIVTLTLLPVLCSWVHAQRRARAAQPRLRGRSNRFTPRAWIFASPIPGRRRSPRPSCWRVRCCWSPASAPSSCRIWTKARCGCAPPCPTRFRSTNRRRSRRKVRDNPALLPRSHHGRLGAGRPDDGTDPTGFFNVEFFVGLKPYAQWTGPYRTKADADRGHQQEARGLSRHHLQLHPAGRGRGGRGRNRPEKRAGGQGVRLRSADAAAQRAKPSSSVLEEGARHPRRDAGAGTWASPA